MTADTPSEGAEPQASPTGDPSAPQMLIEEQDDAADAELLEEGQEEKQEEERKKLTQMVESSDIGPCKKHVKVTVDRADIDRLLNDKFSTLMTETRMPGFRPGK